MLWSQSFPMRRAVHAISYGDFFVWPITQIYCPSYSGKNFLGNGSFMALMVERTWRHSGMKFFCLVVLPPLVFEVFRFARHVESNTPSSSSPIALLLFDAQPNLRLQTIYLPLLVLWSARSSFADASPCDCGLAITAATPAIRAKTSNKNDKGIMKYKSHTVQCFDAEFEVC